MGTGATHVGPTTENHLSHPDYEFQRLLKGEACTALSTLIRVSS
jgi:hypothetical protein